MDTDTQTRGDRQVGGASSVEDRGRRESLSVWLFSGGALSGALALPALVVRLNVRLSPAYTDQSDAVWSYSLALVCLGVVSVASLLLGRVVRSQWRSPRTRRLSGYSYYAIGFLVSVLFLLFSLRPAWVHALIGWGWAVGVALPFAVGVFTERRVPSRG
jgi:MFS family permease